MNTHIMVVPLLPERTSWMGSRAVKKNGPKPPCWRGRGGSSKLPLESIRRLNEPPRLRPAKGLRDISLMGAATPPSPRRGIPAHSVFLVCCKLSDEIRISDRPDPRFSGSKDHSIWFEVRLLIRLVLIVRCRVWDSTWNRRVLS